jgi:hypothetical protein
LFPIREWNAFEYAPNRKHPEEFRPVERRFNLGDFNVKSLPPHHVVHGFRNEAPVPGSPALVALQGFFDHFIGILPLVKYKVGGIDNCKNKVSVQTHTGKLACKGIAFIRIRFFKPPNLSAGGYKKGGISPPDIPDSYRV